MKKTNIHRGVYTFALLVVLGVSLTGCFGSKQKRGVDPMVQQEKGENSFSIGASEGSIVTIARANLSAPGFIAIHADSGTGKPGSIIGVSDYLSQGSSSGFDITTSQELFVGATYFASLRADDGDTLWNEVDDGIVIDSSGGQVTKKFLVADKNAPSLTDGSTKTIKVFAMNYAFDTKEILVKRGETVRIELTSNEGLHDLVIDEFNVKTDQVSTGGTAIVEFVADKKGSFEYYCSMDQHRQLGMTGTLIVE